MTVSKQPQNSQTEGETDDSRERSVLIWTLVLSALAHILPLVTLLSMDLGPMESELDQAWISELRDARTDEDRWAEIQPEPEPEPEEESEPEPEPEDKPEPEPKPEPDPEPKPKPEPEERPTDETQAALGTEDAPEDTETTSENPDQPVAMPDLVIESGSGPTVQAGSGGPGNKKGPNKFGRGKLGGSPDGEGTGDGDAPPKSGGETRSAKAVSRPTAPSSEYPAEAKRRSVSGEVVAILTIDEKGDVTDVKIVKGVGAGLDELAAKYLAKWKFDPALENGRPVVSTKRVEYVFELES